MATTFANKRDGQVVWKGAQSVQEEVAGGGGGGAKSAKSHEDDYDGWMCYALNGSSSHGSESRY